MLSLREKINDLPIVYKGYSDQAKIYAYLLYVLLVANDNELLPKGRKSLLYTPNMLGNSIYDRCLDVSSSFNDYIDIMVYASSVFYTHMSTVSEKYKAISPKEINSSYTKESFNRIRGKVSYRYISLPNMDMSFAIALPWYVGDTYTSIREKVLSVVINTAPDLVDQYLKMSKGSIIGSALSIPDISLAPATYYMLRHDYTSLKEASDIIDFNVQKKGLNEKVVLTSIDSRLEGDAY